MESEYFIWHERPNLVKPYLILALDGWTNAGQVASAISWYLIGRLKATLFMEFKSDEFYVYQTSGTESKRPLVNIENGMVQSLKIVTTNFCYSKDETGRHDIILVSGPEPDQRWIKYTQLLLDFAREYKVEKIVAIGGIFDSIPHTVPTRISGVINDTKLKDEVQRQGIDLINYKGPSSIYTLLMVEAAKVNLPMLSMFAHIPHYIQVLNFIACYNVMLKLSALLDMKIELEAARKDSEYLYTQVDQAIEQKPELKEYLKTLEVEYRKDRPRSPKPISQNIVKEIEDLLKGNQS